MATPRFMWSGQPTSPASLAGEGGRLVEGISESLQVREEPPWIPSAPLTWA